jgi:hypothetical protein
MYQIMFNWHLKNNVKRGLYLFLLRPFFFTLFLLPVCVVCCGCVVEIQQSSAAYQPYTYIVCKHKPRTGRSAHCQCWSIDTSRKILHPRPTEASIASAAGDVDWFLYMWSFFLMSLGAPRQPQMHHRHSWGFTLESSRWVGRSLPLTGQW